VCDAIWNLFKRVVFAYFCWFIIIVTLKNEDYFMCYICTFYLRIDIDRISLEKIKDKALKILGLCSYMFPNQFVTIRKLRIMKFFWTVYQKKISRNFLMVWNWFNYVGTNSSFNSEISGWFEIKKWKRI